LGYSFLSKKIQLFPVVSDFPSFYLYLISGIILFSAAAIIVKLVLPEIDSKIKRTPYLLKIKINLGHETLKEKDILSLITGELRDQYIKYTNSWKNFDAIKGLHLAADLLISGFLFYIFFGGYSYHDDYRESIC